MGPNRTRNHDSLCLRKPSAIYLTYWSVCKGQIHNFTRRINLTPPSACSCQYGNQVLAKFLNFRLGTKKMKNKLRDLSPRANYTDRAATACRRS
jgi:hypothetical protein